MSPFSGCQPLKTIAIPIRVDHGLLAFHTGTRQQVFHPDYTGVALFVEMLEDVPVIHLPRRRFLASWVVADLEVSYFYPRLVDVGDDIPLRESRGGSRGE